MQCEKYNNNDYNELAGLILALGLLLTHHLRTTCILSPRLLKQERIIYLP